MLAFVVSRLAQALAVMLAVSFLCFVLFNFVGDPVSNMVGQEATADERAEMRRNLGLEEYGLRLRERRKLEDTHWRGTG